MGIALFGLLGVAGDGAYRLIRRRKWFVLGDGAFLMGLPVWYWGLLFFYVGSTSLIRLDGVWLVNTVGSAMAFVGYGAVIWTFFSKREQKELMAAWDHKEMSPEIAASTIAYLVEQLELFGLIRLKRLKGCSEQDIEQVEMKVGHQLPGLVREYLRVMGKDSGGFMPEYQMKYPEILDYRNRAIQLIGEQAFTEEVGQDALVIAVFDFLGFLFVRLGDGDNPDVWEFDVEQDVPNPVFTFAHYLFDQFEEHRTADKRTLSERSPILRLAKKARNRWFGGGKQE